MIKQEEYILATYLGEAVEVVEIITKINNIPLLHCIGLKRKNDIYTLQSNLENISHHCIKYLDNPYKR